MGNGVTIIPQNCFLECKALNKIDLPTSVETIGEEAFKNCSSLCSLSIPESVTKIYKSAFVGCSALSSLHIADSENVLWIGYGYYSGTNNGAFNDCPLYDVYIGRNIKPLYTTNQWIFKDHASLSEVTLGGDVTLLCDGLFQNCTNLQTVSVETEKLVKIGSNTFYNCDKLSEITQNSLNNVEEIGDYAFYRCYALTEIILPKIKLLGEHAFNLGNLQTVFLGNDLNAIPNYCFIGQDKLKSVYLGNSITTIGSMALFTYSGNLDIYIYSDNTVSIQDNTLYASTINNFYVVDPNLYSTDKYDRVNNIRKLVDISSSGVFPYSGKIPSLSIIVNSGQAEYEIANNSTNISVGEHKFIDMNFSYLQWSTTVNIPCDFSITPIPLTVVANDATKKYGEENPEFACSYFGFVNNETVDVLTKQPIIETTATTNSNVGTYPIIPYGAEAQNYTFNYERGTLTISKANQSIEWEQDFSSVNVGDKIELTASSTAGLPIKYTATDETIADIFTQNGTKYVEFLKPGRVSIRANQEGSENYNEADRVSKTFDVAQPVSSIELNKTSVELIVGDGFQLSAIVYPNDATSKTVTWKSNNATVATVDADGLIKALAEGECEVSATANDDSGVYASCLVKVKNDENAGIDSISTDGQEEVEVFTTTGILIYKGIVKNMPELHTGIYIVKTANGTPKKISIP